MKPPDALAVDLQGERVLLLPQRALVLPARATVLIADPHFGKDDIFRRAGIALPRGPAIADLQRLTGIIAAHAATRLIILGDFVHGATRTGDAFLHAFALWRQQHPGLAVDVVVGNHDRHDLARGWQQLVGWHRAPLVEPPFVFAHEPVASPNGYVLAGHLHPVVRLGRRRGSGRVPVFWRRPEVFILPSFGSFTGGADVAPGPGDILFAVAPERVVAFPPSAP